jgi:serine/threonine protein phosphatase PrpC
LLIATEAVWSKLSREKILQIIQKNLQDRAEEAAKQVVSQALARWKELSMSTGEDDVSSILIFFKQ